MNQEELIVEALASGVHEENGWLSDAQTAHLEWDVDNRAVRFHGEGSIDLAHLAGIVSSVFEQAHTPTDDEREAHTTAQICEVTVQRGYQAAIADMLWLAKGREQYTGEEVQFQVRSVQQVARAMSGDEFAHHGWLPSWLWDEWEARKAGPWVPPNENGETP